MSAPNIIILRFTTNYHTPDGVPQNCIAIEGSSSPTIIRIVDHIKAITHHDLIKGAGLSWRYFENGGRYDVNMAMLIRFVTGTLGYQECCSSNNGDVFRFNEF